MVNFLIVATHHMWHYLYTYMLEVIHNTNNNVIMITNNGNTTQVLKSVGNNNNIVYNSSKFSVLTQQDRFYPTNESLLLYTHGGFSPIQPIE